MYIDIDMNIANQEVVWSSSSSRINLLVSKNLLLTTDTDGMMLCYIYVPDTITIIQSMSVNNSS